MEKKLKVIIWNVMSILGIYVHPRVAFNQFQKEINKKNKYGYSYLKDKLQNDSALSEKPKEVQELLEYFKEKYLISHNNLRILIICPNPSISPGGYSLYKNFCQSLHFLGISVQMKTIDEFSPDIFQYFRPTVLLHDDFQYIKDKIGVENIHNYRKDNVLIWGHTAYIEAYGYNSPLSERVAWAISNGVNFYYSFRTEEYCRSRTEYAPIFRNNFPFFSIEFGANPLVYYPQDKSNVFDFIFIGSANRDKWDRYQIYFKEIFSAYENGCLYGPGWDFCADFKFDSDLERKAYNASRIGLNLHVQNQLDYACELNERTYQLAMLKVPQLIDHPKILFDRYPEDCFFVAESAEEYHALFKYMLQHPDECFERAEKAYRHTLKFHTCFHRAENFIEKLTNVYHNDIIN